MLERTTPSDVHPIYVVSHLRAGSWCTQKLLKNFDNSAIPMYLVVEEDEIPTYECYDNSPMTLVPIPTDWGTFCPGVGRARQFCLSHGTSFGYSNIWILDDDMIRIKYLYKAQYKSGARHGGEKSDHTKAAEFKNNSKLLEQIMGLASKMAILTYSVEPKEVVGGLRKMHRCDSVKNHQLISVVSGGMTPRQVVNYNLDRIDQYKLSFDLTRFNRHGDDIGFTAQVLAAGLTTFMLSSIVYDHYPEIAQQSVLRTPENKKSLHTKEFKDLQDYPMGQRYLRVTSKDPEDGSYQYGDVDWNRYMKEPNAVSRKELYWNGTLYEVNRNDRKVSTLW